MATKKSPSKKPVAASKKKTVKKDKAPIDPKPQPPPKVGAKAPAFTLVSEAGEKVSLSKLKGKNVVLYFYPKDNTPGCTTEAQGFKALHKALAKEDAVVLGVSRDSVSAHQRFSEKLELPFSLLSDPEGEVIAAYGSWGEKQLYGRRFMGILRTTVLIDKQGKVRKVYPKVSVKTHPEEVLADLKAMT